MQNRPEDKHSDKPNRITGKPSQSPSHSNFETSSPVYTYRKVVLALFLIGGFTVAVCLFVLLAIFGQIDKLSTSPYYTSYSGFAGYDDTVVYLKMLFANYYFLLFTGVGIMVSGACLLSRKNWTVQLARNWLWAFAIALLWLAAFIQANALVFDRGNSYFTLWMFTLPGVIVSLALVRYLDRSIMEGVPCSITKAVVPPPDWLFVHDKCVADKLEVLRIALMLVGIAEAGVALWGISWGLLFPVKIALISEWILYAHFAIGIALIVCSIGILKRKNWVLWLNFMILGGMLIVILWRMFFTFLPEFFTGRSSLGELPVFIVVLIIAPAVYMSIIRFLTRKSTRKELSRFSIERRFDICKMPVFDRPLPTSLKQLKRICRIANLQKTLIITGVVNAGMLIMFVIMSIALPVSKYVTSVESAKIIGHYEHTFIRHTYPFGVYVIACIVLMIIISILMIKGWRGLRRGVQEAGFLVVISGFLWIVELFGAMTVFSFIQKISIVRYVKTFTYYEINYIMVLMHFAMMLPVLLAVIWSRNKKMKSLFPFTFRMKEVRSALADKSEKMPTSFVPAIKRAGALLGALGLCVFVVGVTTLTFTYADIFDSVMNWAKSLYLPTFVFLYFLFMFGIGITVGGLGLTALKNWGRKTTIIFLWALLILNVIYFITLSIGVRCGMRFGIASGYSYEIDSATRLTHINIFLTIWPFAILLFAFLISVLSWLKSERVKHACKVRKST